MNLTEQNKAGTDGMIIDQKPSRKAFHLNDILSLTTGLQIAKEGAAALHRLTAYIMEEEASVRTTALHAHVAKKCIEEQLPFLRDINVTSLYSIYNYKSAAQNPYLNVWRDMQALRFGEEHYLVPLSRWQKRQQSHKLPPLPANLDSDASRGLLPG